MNLRFLNMNAGMLLEFYTGIVSLTILQSRDSFAFLAVLAVPDVVGGFYSELVGCEGLEPV